MYPINAATTVAANSSMKFRHGAVIVHNRKIIAGACNRETSTKETSHIKGPRSRKNG